MDDMTVVVLIYQEYEHMRGRRYKRDSPMACLFDTVELAQMRVDVLKTLADPDQLARAYGAHPHSYEWQMYRLEPGGGAHFAIRSGTTENHVKER